MLCMQLSAPRCHPSEADLKRQALSLRLRRHLVFQPGKTAGERGEERRAGGGAATTGSRLKRKRGARQGAREEQKPAQDEGKALATHPFCSRSAPEDPLVGISPPSRRSAPSPTVFLNPDSAEGRARVTGNPASSVPPCYNTITSRLTFLRWLLCAQVMSPKASSQLESYGACDVSTSSH